MRRRPSGGPQGLRHDLKDKASGTEPSGPFFLAEGFLGDWLGCHDHSLCVSNKPGRGTALDADCIAFFRGAKTRQVIFPTLSKGA
jgi:hypothetical protein